VLPLQVCAVIAALAHVIGQSVPTLHCTQPAVVLQTGVLPLQVTGVAPHVLLVQVPAGVKVVPLQDAAAHCAEVLHWTQ
jgi:hypothetical protein